MKKYKTFKEFWPFYLGEHAKPATKAIHFWGTSFGMCFFLYFIFLSQWAYLPIVIVLIYGPLFLSHTFIEKNKPATLTYPFFSILGDLKMWWLILTRQIK